MTDQVHYFICPHPECGGMVEVPPNQLNCKIFRHGIYKTNIPGTIVKKGTQVHPHAPKELCDYLRENNLVYGCCKPCRITTINSDGSLVAEICDYI